MNEHDSERIAGLLAADGMEATDDLEAADVVVLNTCCIRENADNKLYGHLGHLKALKAAEARPADRGRRVPRPEGPRADRASAPATSTWCSAPTTWRTRPTCSTGRAHEGPIVEILEEHEAYPSALPAAARQPALGVGHDPDRLRQLVHVLHRADRARRRGEPPDGRHRARGRGARGRRRERDHAARPERQLVRPRPRRRASTGRSSPTCCARSTRSTASTGSASRRRTRRTSRPETIAAMAECDVGVRAPAPAAAGGERPHAGAHAPRLHRRALPRRGSRRRAPRSPTSRSPPTSSSASPARPTPTSTARSRSSTPPRTTPRTRSSSRPVRARPRPR